MEPLPCACPGRSPSSPRKEPGEMEGAHRGAAENNSQVAEVLNENSQGGSRRKRTSFTKKQLDILLSAFKENRYPGFNVREKLAEMTGVSEDRVQVWFHNRRARNPFWGRPRGGEAPAMKWVTGGPNPLSGSRNILCPPEQKPPTAFWNQNPGHFLQDNGSAACVANGGQPAFQSPLFHPLREQVGQLSAPNIPNPPNSYLETGGLWPPVNPTLGGQFYAYRSQRHASYFQGAVNESVHLQASEVMYSQASRCIPEVQAQLHQGLRKYDSSISSSIGITPQPASPYIGLTPPPISPDIGIALQPAISYINQEMHQQADCSISCELLTQDV